jgi:hypothetical protein
VIRWSEWGKMGTDTSSKWSDPEFAAIVQELALDDLQKRFLRARWEDQVSWFERNAKKNQQRYYRLRLLSIVGGLIIPALVILNVKHAWYSSAVEWITFGTSLLVAIAVSVEGFFNYGGKWRQYRRTAELLKSQGWQFFELTGDYAHHRSHHRAFTQFSQAVESLISEDVQDYLTKVTREKSSDDNSLAVNLASGGDADAG